MEPFNEPVCGRRASKPRGIWGCVVVLTTVALAGCGNRVHGQSLRSWQTQANAICDRWDHAVHRLGAASAPPAVARVAALAAAIDRRYVNQLAQLPPPHAQAKLADELIGALRHSTSKLARVARAAATGNRAAMDSAGSDLLSANRIADLKARQLHLRQCLSNDG
jgi:hypothetical protein